MKTIIFILILLPTMVYGDTQSKYIKQHRLCMKKMKNLNNGTVISCTDHIVQQSQKDIDTIRKQLAQQYPSQQKQLDQLHQSWLKYRQQLCDFQGKNIASPMETLCEMNQNLNHLNQLQELLE